jgi:hypothetical protein
LGEAAGFAGQLLLPPFRKRVENLGWRTHKVGWETRGRGRYYYRLERRNGRTVRRYIGGGPRGALQAQADAILRERRRARQKAWRTRRAVLAEGEAVLRELSTQLRMLSEAVLLTHGFYRHRGRWRRRCVE